MDSKRPTMRFRMDDRQCVCVARYNEGPDYFTEGIKAIESGDEGSPP